MTPAKLEKILTDHKLWLETDGKEGRRANLSHADLIRANLTDTNLFRADLSHANLTGASLTDANLSHANLSHANLTNADLRGADLTDANLPLSIRDCWSFRHAKFSPEALPWLILHPKWAEWKDTVQIAEKIRA